MGGKAIHTPPCISVFLVTLYRKYAGVRGGGCTARHGEVRRGRAGAYFYAGLTLLTLVRIVVGRSLAADYELPPR
jgi:hypothetical protein